MLIKGVDMTKKKLVRLNRVRKHQRATFQLDIATAKGDKIGKLLMLDWQEIHKRLCGKNRSTTLVDAKQPTKDD